jgi:hypothetical protein
MSYRKLYKTLDQLGQDIHKMDFSDPYEYRLLVMYVVRETLNGIQNKEIKKSSGLRIIVEVLRVVPPLLETTDLYERIKEIEEQINANNEEIVIDAAYQNQRD